MKRLIINFILLSAVAIWFALAPGCESREQELSEKKDPEMENSGIETLSWIIGRWENDKGKKLAGERWVQKDAVTLEGIGYYVDAGDTTVFEKLQIRQRDEDIFYFADVPHNPGPVSFKLVRLTEMEAIFENPEHDFPNRIIYFRRGEDSLHVRIEGMGEKRGRKADFFFLKKPSEGFAPPEG